MRALAINAAQNCSLDFRVWGCLSPLYFAVRNNDVDAARILLQRQRDAVNETKALRGAIVLKKLEILEMLLENGADVHAETDLGNETITIYECSAHVLQTCKFNYEAGNDFCSLYELERMQKINKLV